MASNYYWRERMKQKIVSRWNSDRILFECDVPDDVESGLAIRAALEQATAAKADLSGADLRSADLRSAYLSGADLSGADLRSADLRSAYLSGADLSGADLSGVDLRSAYLSGADLSGADLRSADLRSAYLSGADLRSAYLSGADLSGADLSSAYLSGADLSGADLSGVDLRSAYLSGADLSGADGEQLPRATPEQAIENLDKVREIVLDDEKRLNMGHWHGDDRWRERTCAEETLCGTTHCMAGWLQVCTTEAALKGIDTQLAGTLAAPVASKMFFRGDKEALEWLRDRKYVAETAEAEQRAAARKAKREAANPAA